MSLDLREEFAMRQTPERPEPPTTETRVLNQQILDMLGVSATNNEPSDSMALKQILAQDPYLTDAPQSRYCTPPQHAPIKLEELQGPGLGPINILPDSGEDSDELLAAFAESLTNTSR